MPVLPATWMPGIAAALPVPPSVTATIICVSVAAVSGLDRAAEVRRASSLRTVEPSCATIFCTTYGFGTTPPFAIVEATIAIWSGVTSIRSCPNASRPGSTWCGSFGSKRCVPL